MNTFKIAKARAFKAGNTSANGPQIILSLVGCKDDLFLPLGTFIAATKTSESFNNLRDRLGLDDFTDLEVSHIYSADKNAYNKSFESALDEFKGQTITGDISVRKAGDKYTLDSESREVKLGQAKVGDVRVCEKDGMNRGRKIPVIGYELNTRDAKIKYGEIAKLEVSMFKPTIAMNRSIPTEPIEEPIEEPETIGAFPSAE
jgi:hypothetical protein